MTKPFYNIKMIEESSRYGSGENVPIFNSTIKIGRSDNCNIRFTDKFSNVSREHLILNYQNNNIEIVPIHGSNNKTYVDNAEITKRKVIKSNAIIRAAYKGPRLRIILDGNKKIGIESLKTLEGIDFAIIGSALLFLFLLIKIMIQLAQ